MCPKFGVLANQAETSNFLPFAFESKPDACSAYPAIWVISGTHTELPNCL
jgi:hypothetical protein